jgi:hypothetical protein
MGSLRRTGDCRGQAALELALVLPFILLLILGGLDFGRAYFYKNDTMHLASVAARYATVDSCAACSGGSIASYVKNTAASSELSKGGGQIEAPGATISFCYSGTGAKGDSITAKVSAKYDWLPYFSNMVGLTPADITSTSTMMLEKPAVGAATYSAGPCP